MDANRPNHLHNIREAFLRLRRRVELACRIQLGDDNRVELVREDAMALAEAGENVSTSDSGGLGIIF